MRALNFSAIIQSVGFLLMEQLHFKYAASSEFVHKNLCSDNPKYFYGNLAFPVRTPCVASSEMLLYSVTGLIQTCDRKPEGCSRTVTILLCIHQNAAQKSCFHDKPGSLLHKKFSPQARDVFWALIPSCKQRTWFSQRPVNNNRGSTSPFSLHASRRNRRARQEKRLKHYWTFRNLWEFLQEFLRPCLMESLQFKACPLGYNNNPTVWWSKSTGQLLQERHRVPEATRFLSSPYLN